MGQDLHGDEKSINFLKINFLVLFENQSKPVKVNFKVIALQFIIHI